LTRSTSSSNSPPPAAATIASIPLLTFGQPATALSTTITSTYSSPATETIPSSAPSSPASFTGPSSSSLPTLSAAPAGTGTTPNERIALAQLRARGVNVPVPELLEYIRTFNGNVHQVVAFLAEIGQA
jgi:hypothetical protein